MVIVVCSLKGSPGVTTLSVALAARWPAPGRPVVVECDPSGGSLAARFGLAAAPGLVSLTAAARQNRDVMLLWSHTQSLPGDVPVVVAPPGADYTRAALTTLLDTRRSSVSVLRGATARRPGSVVIADCGRLDALSPAMSIARDADRVVLLARSRADELSHLAAGLSMVDLWATRPGLVLVGPGHPAGEVTRELGIPVLADIPHDPPGARALCGLPGRRRGPLRSPLGQAAHALAHALLSPVSSQMTGHPPVAERPAVPRFQPRLNGARVEDRP